MIKLRLVTVYFCYYRPEKHCKQASIVLDSLWWAKGRVRSFGLKRGECSVVHLGVVNEQDRNLDDPDNEYVTSKLSGRKVMRREGCGRLHATVSLLWRVALGGVLT